MYDLAPPKTRGDKLLLSLYIYNEVRECLLVSVLLVSVTCIYYIHVYTKYMAKKYLLYIHDPRFEKEAKKSELVNQLLAHYYGETIMQPLYAPGGLKKTSISKELKVTAEVSPCPHRNENKRTRMCEDCGEYVN